MLRVCVYKWEVKPQGPAHLSPPTRQVQVRVETTVTSAGRHHREIRQDCKFGQKGKVRDLQQSSIDYYSVSLIHE